MPPAWDPRTPHQAQAQALYGREFRAPMVNRPSTIIKGSQFAKKQLPSSDKAGHLDLGLKTR